MKRLAQIQAKRMRDDRPTLLAYWTNVSINPNGSANDLHWMANSRATTQSDIQTIMTRTVDCTSTC